MPLDPETGKLPNSVKYLTTISVFCGCLTFGVAICFFSPALVDLKNKYDTDIATMSKIFVIMPFLYLCGAMTGGLLYGKFVQRQHGSATCFLGIASVMYAVPHCSTVLQIYICIGFLGFFGGAYDTAQAAWLMEIWESKSGPFLQAQHFCFALGTTLPPFIVSPFLSDNSDDMLESPGGSVNIINNNDTSVDVTDYASKSNLYIPFTIAGSMALCNFIFEIFLITCYKYEKPRRESQVGVKKKVSLPTICMGDNPTTDEAVPEVKSQPDTKTQYEAVPEPQVKSQPDTKTMNEAVPEPQVKSQPDTKTMNEAVPEPQVKSQPDTKTQNEAVPEPPVKSQPDTKTQYKPVPEPQAKVQDPESQLSKSTTSDAKLYKIKLVTLTLLFIAFYVAGELCSIQFMSTFAQFGDLHLSEAEGASALAVLTGSFATGRALGILVTIFLPPQLILAGNLTLIFSGNVVLLIWANSSVKMLWLACAMLGLGFSTMYATFFTIMRTHLEFTEFIVSIILIGACTVELTYPLVVGVFIEQNPLVLTYFNFLTCTVCATVAIIACVYTNRKKSLK